MSKGAVNWLLSRLRSALTVAAAGAGRAAPVRSQRRLSEGAMRKRPRLTGVSGIRVVAAAVALLAAGTMSAAASVPGADVRLTNDTPGSSGYVSNYNVNHPTAPVAKDATLAECSRARG